MGLRIIYGKPGSGKSQYCFNKIANQLKEETKIYMITPEQFSYTAETKLMKAVSSKAVINAEVVTLSRMAYRILNEVGGSAKTQLSKCGKAMLIYDILNKGKKELKFLGKSDENVDLAVRAITELKKHGICLKDLQQETQKIEDTYLQTKLKDITLIYEKWEEQIKGNYIEDTTLLEILASSIESTNFVQNSIIYLDEFAGFTKQEYEIIKQFIKLAKQVNITITTNDLNINTNPDIDIFYSNKITIAKIWNMVNENNFELEEPIHLEKNYRFQTEELKHLSQNIKSQKYTIYEENVENLHLFLAQNPYSEIENIAKEITSLIKNQNRRYKDIAIITRNISEYAPCVRAIFAKYQIPVFIDEKREVTQNSIIQYVLAILEVLKQNFSKNSIWNYLKLGFSQIDFDEIFELENYTNKWGIKQNKWKKDFCYEIEKEEKRPKIERYNELRKQIIEPLLMLKEKIDSKKTVNHITKCLYEWLQNQNIEETITKKIQELEEKNLLDLAQEYLESYKIILNVLDEVILVLGEQKTTIEEYIKILKIGLRNSQLAKIPGTQDQVIFGDIERSRTHKVKTVFIIGLNDGSFPSVNKEEGFLDDADREKLKQDGIELAKGTKEKLYEDNFNIYKAFTTAQNNIYLSYLSSDKEGKPLRPSMLIHKIKKMYPKLEEKSDFINKSYVLANPLVTYEALLENILKLKEKKAIDPIWYHLYQYYKRKSHWQEKLANDLKGISHTNIPQNLQPKSTQMLYGNTLNTSVSRLEKYRSCPFSYYLQYGLKLKEKEELKIHTFQTGTFMHETIDEFFKQVKEQGLELVKIEEQDIYQMVSKIMEQSLQQSKNYIFGSTAKYKLLVGRLKKMVSKALKYIIQTLIYSDFSIEGVEVEFAKKGKYQPIELTLEDGKKIEITGKIDRVDISKGNYIRIIDYKSASKNIDLNEVYAGLQIQLLTYLDAICQEEERKPAGIFYFSLLEQMIKADRKISEEEIEEQIRKNFRMKGLILADVKIIKMNDNTLTHGTSKLVPASITTSGSVNEKWTNGVNEKEFRVLQDYINFVIKQIAKEIWSGKIDLKPYNKNGKTPCEYCEYKVICGFCAKNNPYHYIDKKSKDDILSKMQNDMKKVEN